MQMHCSPSCFTMNGIGHCFFKRFCYKFKRKICKVNTVQPHCSLLHVSPWMILFTVFRFVINLKGKKILNPVKFMVRVHPTSFTMDDTIHFFCFKKKKFSLFVSTF